MAIAPNISGDFNIFVNKFGRSFVLYNYTSTYDDYDQETMTLAGSSIGSCVVMPVNESRNGDDYQYLQQGLIKVEDLKVFMPSGPISSNNILALSTGSYTILRIFPWDPEGVVTYNKVYVRTSGG